MTSARLAALLAVPTVRAEADSFAQHWKLLSVIVVRGWPNGGSEEAAPHAVKAGGFNQRGALALVGSVR